MRIEKLLVGVEVCRRVSGFMEPFFGNSRGHVPGADLPGLPMVAGKVADTLCLLNRSLHLPNIAPIIF